MRFRVTTEYSNTNLIVTKRAIIVNNDEEIADNI